MFANIYTAECSPGKDMITRSDDVILSHTQGMGMTRGCDDFICPLIPTIKHLIDVCWLSEKHDGKCSSTS